MGEEAAGLAVIAGVIVGVLIFGSLTWMSFTALAGATSIGMGLAWLIALFFFGSLTVLCVFFCLVIVWAILEDA